MELPDFLDQRDKTLSEAERLDRLAASLPAGPQNKRGTAWVMPTYRQNPNKQLRSEVPSRDKRKNRTQPTEKVEYPTTVALQAAVTGMTPAAKRKALYAVAVENGLSPTRWDNLNNGQVAMNLGNVLRGRYYKNHTILIQGEEIE